MRVYVMFALNIRQGMEDELFAFLRSRAYKKVCLDLEKEMGLKYLETYVSTLASNAESGDYDVYRLWEMPNYAALDKARDSPAWGRLNEMVSKYFEPRPEKKVFLRKVSELKLTPAPKKK
jgi:hypothetical protein